MSESIRPGRVAVIDIGKTNAKVVVIDTGSGEEIAAEKQANPVLRDGIYPHYDVEMLWRFILSALQRFGHRDREPAPGGQKSNVLQIIIRGRHRLCELKSCSMILHDQG